jgi:hypothetical protein
MPILGKLSMAAALELCALGVAWGQDLAPRAYDPKEFTDWGDCRDSDHETPIAENQLQQWRLYQLRGQLSKRVNSMAVFLDWPAKIKTVLAERSPQRRLDSSDE